MLKIKENVDLKELEKFGFCYNEICKGYIKKVRESACDLVVCDDKSIYHQNYTTADMVCYGTELIVAIYDLIQAGLVEKV